MSSPRVVWHGAHSEVRTWLVVDSLLQHNAFSLLKTTYNKTSGSDHKNLIQKFFITEYQHFCQPKCAITHSSFAISWSIIKSSVAAFMVKMNEEIHKFSEISETGISRAISKYTYLEEDYLCFKHSRFITLKRKNNTKAMSYSA